jgi:PAS domain S-box-containing protein
MFQLLFERSTDAIFLLDPRQEVFVDCNQAAVDMMGAASKKQLLMVHPAELSPEFQPDGRSSRKKTPEMIAIALAKGSHRFEWLARRFDGALFPVEVVVIAIEKGDNPLLATICRDISERKAAEQDIHELNASLERRVAERTGELLQANDRLTRAEQQSSRRAERVQKHRDVLLELAQMNKSDWHGALHEICALAASSLEVARVGYWSLTEENSAIVCEDLYLHSARSTDEKARGTRLERKDCPEYFEALTAKRSIVAIRAHEHPATRGLTARYLRPLGISSMLDAPVWVRGELVGVLCHEHVGPVREWTAEEIDFASALAVMVSLALEESQRARAERLLRESEARFSAAFMASPVFMTIARFSDGRYILANEAFLAWTQYRHEEVLGKNSLELALWADPAEREPFWAELRRTGFIRERECRVRNRYGQVITMLLSADIIEINGARHTLTVGLDITQRKKAEAELRKTLVRETELGQLRSSFVSMVSHEFRTPLGIIQSSAEILDDYLERLSPQERREHLRSIQGNTRRMAALMEEVLLLGGFDAGKMQFRPAPVDFRALAARLIEEVTSATDSRCPVELTVHPSCRQLHADERLLRHIFSNLLTNAVKYSEPGKYVEFEISREGTEMVGLVSDRGIGIPQADREWLFNAFHRGRNVGNRPGSGLGLVIVKRCVDLHRGTISIESDAGQGTRVAVRLPVFDAEPQIQRRTLSL